MLEDNVTKGELRELIDVILEVVKMTENQDNELRKRLNSIHGGWIVVYLITLGLIFYLHH